MKPLFLILLTLLPAIGWGQTFTSSNLPIVVLDTKGAPIVDDPKIVATMRIIDNGAGKTNNLTDRASFSSVIGIELRGSTSQQFPKKPYGVELRDAAGTNSVVASVLGMPAESDWVFNASYNDKTLLRETLTYDLFRKMSKYYASRFRYCELVLNGQYQGIYIVMERLKRDKNRINISSIKKTDISGDALTGGYILKIDKPTGSTSRGWQSPYTAGLFKVKYDILIDRPKPEDLAEEQFQYIKKYVTDFENALDGKDYADATNGWRKYADEESFVDYMLINEIVKNVDAYRISAFFYKDRDSKSNKLVMGPIWDFNISMGNANYCDGNSPRGWSFDHDLACPRDGFQIPFWWKRLLTDLPFAKRVKDRYKVLRQGVLTPQKLHAFIDSTAGAMPEARVRNFARWPIIGVNIWPNEYVGPTYQAEVDYLKSWLTQRLAWMDTAIEPFGQIPLATEPNELAIGPNPSTGDVQVRCPLAQPGDVVLTISTTQGRSVGTFRFANQPAGVFNHTINAGTFTAAGTYVLRIQTPTGASSKVLLRE